MLSPRTILKGESGATYIVSAPCGRGGVGEVFKAQRIADRLTVAVKALHSRRFDITDASKARLQKEALATLAVTSPHVIRGLDSGYSEAGDMFLVLEWAGGGTLKDRIEAGDYGQAEALRWTCQLLQGLLAIHGQGFIHRDIKPNNVILDGNGNAKLADLGIARHVDDGEFLTVSNDVMGSLLYISRRQRQSPTEATFEDDFYSLWLVLHEIAAAQRFHVDDPPLSQLSNLRLPIVLTDLIDKGRSSPPDWEDLRDEFVSCLDLESGGLRRDYFGPVEAPNVLITKHLEDTTRELVRLLKQIPPAYLPKYPRSLPSAFYGEAASAENILFAYDVIDVVEQGFQQAAGQIYRFSQVSLDWYHVLPNAESATWEGDVFVSGTLDPASESLIRRCGCEDLLLYDSHERAWLAMAGDNGVVRFTNVRAKGFEVREDLFPVDFRDRRVSRLDPETRRWLRGLGQSLALALAFGLVDEFASEIKQFVASRLEEMADDGVLQGETRDIESDCGTFGSSSP